MFARRFNPDDLGKERVKPQIPLKKRKLSQTSIEAAEEEEEVLEFSASSSDSSSESESSDSSDSDSDSDSDSGSDSEEELKEKALSESKEGDSKISASSSTEDVDEAEDAMEVDGAEKTKADDEQPASLEPDSAYLKKHAGVFKKFQSAQSNDIEMDHDEAQSEEEVEKRDLAPLPQPELPKDATLRSLKAHTKSLDWLAKPTYVSPEETSSFSAFKISPPIMKNIEAMGFKEAFSVQVAVFRMLLEDIQKNKLRPDFMGDILVNAATGSGKTLAYCVPIIEALHNRIVPRVRAVILVPTRPLTQQVTSTLMELSKRTKLSIVSLSSDMSISDEGHKISSNVPDIIVSTPGRLVEHLINGSISFEALRFLVIDEADRLLNQSFQNWSEIVVSNIEKTRNPQRNVGNSWSLQPQKLVFSATLTTDAGKLSALKFKKPRLIVVDSKTDAMSEMFSVPATLTESKILFASSDSAHKPLLLAKLLISANKLKNVLIFSRSNDSTLRLAKVLEGLFKKLHPSSPINVAYMNSTNNLSSVRNRVFRDFTSGDINILVATDLIARGLDLLSITDVVNYDLPVSSREYVHRVGRTARANQRGEALSMVFGKGENQWFDSLIEDVGRSRPVEELYPKAIDLYVDDHEKRMLEDVLTKLAE